MKDETARYWNTQYQDGTCLCRWQLSAQSDELAAVLDEMDFPFGSSSLDVGCGAGGDCALLAQRGFQAHGIDISDAALKLGASRAQAVGVEVRWIQAGALNVPLPRQSVAFAHERGCLHHIARHERAGFAAEMDRILEPGGYLLLRDIDHDFRGLIGLDRQVVERFFGSRFRILSVESFWLRSDQHELPGNMALLQKHDTDRDRRSG